MPTWRDAGALRDDYPPDGNWQAQRVTYANGHSNGQTTGANGSPPGNRKRMFVDNAMAHFSASPIFVGKTAETESPILEKTLRLPANPWQEDDSGIPNDPEKVLPSMFNRCSMTRAATNCQVEGVHKGPSDCVGQYYSPASSNICTLKLVSSMEPAPTPNFPPGVDADGFSPLLKTAGCLASKVQASASRSASRRASVEEDDGSSERCEAFSRARSMPLVEPTPDELGRSQRAVAASHERYEDYVANMLADQLYY